jgi:acyl-CoA thioesterase
MPRRATGFLPGRVLLRRVRAMMRYNAAGFCERKREVQMSDDKRLQAVNEYIQRDPFAVHLGATVEIPEPGRSRASLTITPEVTNFHGMAHGGVVFALGDMAFAAASNSRGQVAVAINVSISFLRACKAGDNLVAEAREEHAG